MPYFEKFEAFFQRAVAAEAAHPLGDGAEIEFEILDSQREVIEVFTFLRERRSNRVVSGKAKDPQIGFRLTEGAADAVLEIQSEEVGAIGVEIGKLIVSKDPAKKIGFQIYSGFWTLFRKGYLGVIKSGGGAFARFLASRGLNGVDGVKALLKKASPR